MDTRCIKCLESAIWLFVLSQCLQKGYAVQCFSCKGVGLNEVAANIHCLEKGYLENCDDFYEYYSKVEDKKVLTDEYYYDDEDEYYYDDDFDPDSSDYYESSDRERRDTSVLKSFTQYGNASDSMYIVYKEEKSVNDGNKNYIRQDGIYHSIRLDDVPKNVAPKDKKSSKEESEKSKKKSTEKQSASEMKMSLPKDPEHHCYSTTVKQGWESYSVEKGCRKIEFCRSDLENKPEWTRPWNFCCDKSRCNAKQVKDKPQRIYGMNCRRTDDCIQGHVSRSVCPHLFKSCPKIPPTLIKMECIAKGVDPTDLKQRYRNPFQEKKCQCTTGNFPKGPICTSAARTLWRPLTLIAFCVIAHRFL